MIRPQARILSGTADEHGCAGQRTGNRICRDHAQGALLESVLIRVHPWFKKNRDFRGWPAGCPPET